MSLLTILAAATVADGIGMDDLTWLAGLISAIVGIGGRRWHVSWPTNDAWPSSLPGTAA